MSRSFRKTPIFGHAGAYHGQKPFKAEKNGQERMKVRTLLATADDLNFDLLTDIVHTKAARDWHPNDGMYYWDAKRWPVLYTGIHSKRPIMSK